MLSLRFPQRDYLSMGGGEGLRFCFHVLVTITIWGGVVGHTLSMSPKSRACCADMKLSRSKAAVTSS